jgi:integrase
MSSTPTALSTTNRLPPSEIVLVSAVSTPTDQKINKTIQDTKSGQKVAKSERAAESRSATKKKESSKLPKTHKDYWGSRVFKPAYTVNGVRKESSLYCIRHQYTGRRELFTLDTAIKGDAGLKALQIWMSLRTVGWDETLRAFKPRATFVPPQFATLDDYFKFLEAHGLRSGAELKRNLSKCYTLLAGMFKMDRPKSRYDARKSGLKSWHEKIRRIRIGQLTADRVALFKAAYLKERNSNPLREIAAQHTLDSYLRAAKALFGPSIRKELAALGVTLPEPVPFATASFVSKGRSSFRYYSRMNPHELTALAVTELSGDEIIEQLKIFLLALHLGLRRNEIDKLTWAQFDFAKRTLHVTHTEYIELKSQNSEGDMHLEPELADFFHELSKKAKGIFVISSKNAPRTATGYDHYRANKDFTALCAWLRSKEVKTQKPIHTLRKEFGRLITERLGIFAASLALRHSSVAVTSIFYADDRRPKYSGLGSSLKPPAEAPVTPPV